MAVEECVYVEFTDDGVYICNNHDKCKHKGKEYETSRGIETLCKIRGISNVIHLPRLRLVVDNTK